MTESDSCRSQMLTDKDGLRTEIIKIFVMAVDPYDLQFSRTSVTLFI